MDRADGITARLAAGHNGMLTRTALASAGVTQRQIAAQVAAGVLVRMHNGTYRHAAVELEWRGRIAAAVLAAGPGAVASHRSAARLHGIQEVPRWRPEVTAPTLDKPIVPGVHVHRTNLLEPVDLAAAAGVPVTAIPRTLLDLGAVLPYELVEHVVQVAMIRRQVSLPELLAVLERVGGRGRRGTGSLRAVVRNAMPDARAESLLEHLLHDLLLEAGAEPPELQHDLVCADGRRVRLDFAWPARRVAVEANGHRWHGTRRQMEHDLARTRSIQASGWTLHAYGYGDVTERRAGTLLELRRLSAL